MAKILVTGATGFIGKYLISSLVSAGHDIVAVNSRFGDVAKESTWLNFPPVEAVIHLAGKSFVPDSWEDPAGFVACNLLGTIAALGYCKRNGARLVFLSSYLYGNSREIPIPETAHLVANNPYALSKKLAEEACRFFSEKFSVHTTVLRPFNVYGAGQQENFLIPSIIRQIDNGDTIQVKDLGPKRDYVYISDLIDAIMKAVDFPQGYGVFNIGSGMSHSVSEVIKIVQGIRQTRLHVCSSGERRQDEIMNAVADISAAKKALGWMPKWTLAQGIQKMIQGI